MAKQKKASASILSETEANQTIEDETHRLQTDLEHLPVVKIVGMSGAGKSTLVRLLRDAGFNARAVSQEHSAIPDLWQEFGRPLVLIYLTLSLETQAERRADVSWTPAYYQEEESRLESARTHADLRIDTSTLTPEGVYELAFGYLQRANIRRADHPLQPRPSTGSALQRPAPDPETPDTGSKT